MITDKRKLIFIAVCVISITSFGFVSNAVATNENGEHSEMKQDKHGKVSQGDFIQHHRWMFEKNDANNDGFLDRSEMKTLHKMVEAMHKRSDAHE